MSIEQDREYLIKEFKISPRLDRFQTLAELLQFVAPHANLIHVHTLLDLGLYDPKEYKILS